MRMGWMFLGMAIHAIIVAGMLNVPGLVSVTPMLQAQAATVFLVVACAFFVLDFIFKSLFRKKENPPK